MASALCRPVHEFVFSGWTADVPPLPSRNALLELLRDCVLDDDPGRPLDWAATIPDPFAPSLSDPGSSDAAA